MPLDLVDSQPRQVATGTAWQLVADIGAMIAEAAQRAAGGPDFDQRLHRLFERALPLLPSWRRAAGSKAARHGAAPAYTRNDGDLRPLRSVLPAGIDLDARLAPVVGGKLLWLGRTVDLDAAEPGAGRTAATLNLAAACAVLALLSEAVWAAWGDGE